MFLFGFLLFVFTQNIHGLIKFPKFNFRLSNQITNSRGTIKKEPIINQKVDLNNNETKYNEQNLPKSNLRPKMSNNYLSPSLEILDNEINNLQKKKNQSNIKERSELLEKVFEDFNIQINVINVKIGPVVTLYEILPAAGTKINTIINLASDISRSMGVSCNVFHKYLELSILVLKCPMITEKVTIKELLSNENFKSTSHKIPYLYWKRYFWQD